MVVIELYMAVMLAAVLIPWGVVSVTAFFTEFSIGWVTGGLVRIMVTAASDLIPPPLLAQLKPGGRMVIPTGIPDKQTLVLVEKSAAGSLSAREILPVRFSELEDPGQTVGAA